MSVYVPFNVLQLSSQSTGHKWNEKKTECIAAHVKDLLKTQLAYVFFLCLFPNQYFPKVIIPSCNTNGACLGTVLFLLVPQLTC